MAIGDKKASLIRKDGSNITLNKPITIPSSVTDITQITEPGWYHGSFIFRTAIYKFDWSSPKLLTLLADTPYDPDRHMGSGEMWGLHNSIKNIPSHPYSYFTYDAKYFFDLFVTGIGQYVINVGERLYYGYLKDGSITWINTTHDIKDSLDSSAIDVPLSANQGKKLNEKKLDKPTISTTDLTAGTSNLATGQLYFVYE